VAAALREAGHEVRALARDPARAEALAGRGIEIVAGDVLDPAPWRERLAGMDALVHTAATVETWTREPSRFDRVNVEGTLMLLREAAGAGVERLLVTSSLFALGPSERGRPRDEEALRSPRHPLHAANDYVRTKRLLVERLLAGPLAARVVLLVPSVLFGPGRESAGNHTARIFRSIAVRRFPGLVGNGEQEWNLVPVARAARGHVLALERGAAGRAYILGGEDWTQRRLVAFAAAELGVPAPTRPLGRVLPLVVGTTCEAWARATGAPPYLTRGEVRLYDAHWSVTSARAVRELGYSDDPITPDLRDTLAWVRGGAR
jgi:nucleoside-diphosphate-sugar epimerase